MTQNAVTRHAASIEARFDVPVVREVDVVVVGGGPAGVMTAVAAARRGARVVLLERLAALGGNLTAGLVNPMLTFHSKSGRQVVKGLAQELVDRLVRAGGSPGHVPDPVGFVKTVTPFDPDILRTTLDSFVTEAGVEVFFHSQVIAVHKQADRLTHVVAVAGKEGLLAFAARVFVDASGDGDVAAFSGEEWTLGRKIDGHTQPMTLMFRMGGVDLRQVRDYVERHPEEFFEGGRALFEAGGYSGVSGFFRHVEEAVRRGELPPYRDRVLFFGGVAPGEVIVNVTRVAKATVVSARSWTDAEIEGRRQVWQYARFLQKRIPGFEKARVIHVGQQLGIRESRLIQGRYVLVPEDLVKGTAFADRIAAGSYPVDIHSPSDESLVVQELEADYYFIPFRALLPRRTRNLLLAGRCISATHEACAAIRVSPIAMAIGEAAGIAAALALQHDVDPCDVDPAEIQSQVDLPPAEWGREAHGDGYRDRLLRA